jgi:Fic family protein
MKKFLRSFNSDLSIDPLLKSAVSQLWFVTAVLLVMEMAVYPKLTDILLAQADGISQRCYSMSAQIRLERKSYYDILEYSQKEV